MNADFVFSFTSILDAKKWDSQLLWIYSSCFFFSPRLYSFSITNNLEFDTRSNHDAFYVAGASIGIGNNNTFYTCKCRHSRGSALRMEFTEYSNVANSFVSISMHSIVIGYGSCVVKQINIFINRSLPWIRRLSRFVVNDEKLNSKLNWNSINYYILYLHFMPYNAYLQSSNGSVCV